jgi:hypothetical protein
MSVRFRVIVLALIGLSAAAFAAYWFHVAGQLRKGIESFAAQRRAEGWVVEMAPVETGGFPKAATARLNALVFRSPTGLSWRADSVAITVPLLDPLNIVVETPGFHRLVLPGWSGIVSAASARTRIRLTTGGEVAGLAFDAATLALEQPEIDPLTATGVAFTLERLNPPSPRHDLPSLAGTLALRGLDLPDISGLPLTRRIEDFQVEARVMGTLPDAPPLAALAAWSAEGGVVELDRIALTWSPLTLEGDGTLAFDSVLQPLLATTVRVRGWSEFVVRLVQAGLVEPGMAEAAKIMLAIMSRPDAQGRPTLTIPLTVQDGILTVGQVRVMRVPPLPIPPPYSGGLPP